MGNFSITQVNDPAPGSRTRPDKAGKDNNFRGLTIFNNTLYVTKGSGGNGINTVYQVGYCREPAHAGHRRQRADHDTARISHHPRQECRRHQFPFGIWFANATTLYVADEGDGTTADAAKSQFAGLQKWSLVNGAWQLDYVLQNGLNLGQPYSIPSYPARSIPPPTACATSPAAVNGDGTVTIWAVTSTVSANGDQGADPNKLVVVNDILDNTDPSIAPLEPFTTLRHRELCGGAARRVIHSGHAAAPPSWGRSMTCTSWALRVRES